MDNPSDLLPESTSRDRLNTWVAVFVALFATFMAVTKVKDDNIVQAMLQAKSDAVDTWSEYQAKRIKHHLLELGRDQAIVWRSTVVQHARSKWDEQVKHYESEISRYKNEEEELKGKAREFENQYNALNFRDDQFDLSDAVLSVSIATLAMTSLTRKRWLLWISMVFGAFGVVMGTAGLLGMGIHPNWLIKLLS
jgi:hypothetical protein